MKKLLLLLLLLPLAVQAGWQWPYVQDEPAPVVNEVTGEVVEQPKAPSRMSQVLWYAGAGMGRVDFGENSIRETGVRMFGGFENLFSIQRVDIGLEIGYADLGEYHGTEFDSMMLELMVRVPIANTPVDWLVDGGVAYTDGADAYNGNHQDTGTVWGTGFEWDPDPKWTLRVQWRQHDIEHLDLDEYTFNASRKF